MKPNNPDLVEVTYHERNSFRVGNGGRYNSRSLARETKAKSANPFFERQKWYSLALLPDGFKLKIPTLTDKRLIKSNLSGHVMVTGLEPGLYEITEQNQDLIIAKKLKP